MKKIITIVLIAFVLYFAFVFIYQQAVRSTAGTNDEEMILVVEKGEGVKAISRNLAEAGLIKSTNWFEFYIWKNNLDAKLQAGEYLLKPSMRLEEIATALVAGKSLGREREIKIIEGWDIKEIGQYLENTGLVSQKDFVALAEQPLLNFQDNFINKYFSDGAPAGADLEGYLFPDTYRVYKDASAKDLIDKFLANLESKVSDELVSETRQQGKTVFEILTMASMIEKEVRSTEDMKIVSGIFWNRIAAGQALESCASLAYILGENKQVYSIEDTKINSPYNTYQNPGLPPGPICNPGLNAILAAIYPADTDYYYFLSRLDTGETIFSKTYEEHLANKAKFLR